MKPDLIITWPDTIEFPLFSKFLNEDRDRFEKVIISFTETNWGGEVVDQIMRSIDNAIFLPPVPAVSGEDWRNNAVNRALKHSFSPWVWFTEQDFFPHGEAFWTVTADLMKYADAIGIKDSNRLHPCSLFIKRSMLDKTSKDFSAKPDEGYDHFGKIYQDLKELKAKIAYPRPELYHHMSGLTHNLFLVKQGKQAIYKPEEFNEYLEKIKAYESTQKLPT